MTTATRPPRPPATSIHEAFLSERTALHLATRLVAHTYMALAPERRKHGRKTAVIWTASVLADVGTAVYLHKSRSRRLRWRGALDIADMAAWSYLAPGGRLDSAALIAGTPLVAEATFRDGLPAVPKVAAAHAVVAASQLAARRGVRVQSHRWTAAAALGGLALRRYQLRHDEHVLVAHEAAAERNARYESVIYEGQQFVSKGSDTAVDILPEFRAVVPDVEDRIGALHDKCNSAGERFLGGSGAKYLKLVLDQWQNKHNRSIVTLGEDVTFDYRSSADLVVITRRQAEQVVAELDGRHLAGRVLVGVKEGRRRVAGSPFTLVLLDGTIPIDADLDDVPTTYDPSALVLLLGAFRHLTMMSRSNLASPLARTAPAAVLSLGLAAGSVLVNHLGEEVPPNATIAGAEGIALIGTLLTTGAMGNRRQPDGIENFPAAGQLTIPAILLSMHWSRLRTHEQVLLTAAAVGVLGIGWLQLPKPRSRYHGLLQMSWIALGVVPAYGARKSIEARVDARLDELTAADRAYREAAFRQAAMETYNDTYDLLEAIYERVDELGELKQQRLHQAAAHLAKVRDEIDEADFGLFDAVHRPRRSREYAKRTAFADVDAALDFAAGPGRTLVIDVEGTIVPHGADRAEVQQAMVRVACRAAADDVRRVVFVTNARRPLPSITLHQIAEDIEITVVADARKPWLWRKPLRAVAEEINGAVVIGDQVLSDGMLARSLETRFLHVRPIEDVEPLRDRMLRWAGDLVALPLLFTDVETPLGS